jgi:serine/threonine protein kinase
VGLKLLEYDADSIRDIESEVEILKTCKSPFIVELVGVFIKGKTIWIAMEFCGAGSLADIMAVCQTTLSEAQVAAVMKMSLYGLEYLHAQNIIHRDIKAANVLVTDTGECKLADFGVSAEIQVTLSRKQTVIGTPNWMAPEVITESAYDQRADIWSLGIVAIELALGEPPHSNVHPMTAMFKIPTSAPPTLPADRGYSQDFHGFVRACLQKDPTMRPSATHLLQHPFVRAVADPCSAAILDIVNRTQTEMKSFRDLEQSAVPGQTMRYN